MKRTFIVILITSTVFQIGCSNTNKEIQKENAELKKRNSLLEIVIRNKDSTIAELQKYKINHLFLNYMENQYKKRFVENQCDLLALPVDQIGSLNLIKENTVVDVIDTVDVNNTVWIYVSIPVYDSPTNFKGWIKEVDTVPYTIDNMEKVQGDIKVKPGENVYEVEKFEEINGATPDKSIGFEHGRIQEKKNGFAYLKCAGGRSIWVKETSLIYPTVE